MDRLSTPTGSILRQGFSAPWAAGLAPDILPTNRAALMCLHKIDAAQTQKEWDWAIGDLVITLFMAAASSNSFGADALDPWERTEAIVAVGTRIMRGFKPPPHRAKHITLARDDGGWLRGLPPETTLVEAVAFLAEFRSIPAKLARDRVLRAERELQHRFPRSKPFGHGAGRPHRTKKVAPSK